MAKVSILGAGESGTGAALLAQQKGNQVFVSDKGTIAPVYKKRLNQHKIPFEEGQHTHKKLLTADLVIKSPGIPPTVPIIQAIQQQGIPIIDEVAFAVQYTDAYLIAITGSNGKSTTAQLTYHLLYEAGFNVALVGNIGHSFAYQLTQASHDYYVIEVSSFQLEQMPLFKPNIAVITNITPDHLDRYAGKFEQYVAAKMNILNNMTETNTFIYDADNEAIKNALAQQPLITQSIPVSCTQVLKKGAYAVGHTYHVKLSNTPVFTLTATEEIAYHHPVNVMMAVAIALEIGVQPSAILSALSSFKGLPHRIEWVAQYKGVDFYNDSKATNVEATYSAWQRFDRPIIWIAGGQDKGNDYKILLDKIQNIKTLICLGKDNEKIKQFFASHIEHIKETQSIEEAVQWAVQLSQPQDVVLLSPACASFDLFTNYQERGNLFKKAIQTLH